MSVISVSHKEWDIWLLELVWWSDLVILMSVCGIFLFKLLEIVFTENYTTLLLSALIRYPLGRVIGGTVYPGLTLTAGTLWWYASWTNFCFLKILYPWQLGIMGLLDFLSRNSLLCPTSPLFLSHPLLFSLFLLYLSWHVSCCYSLQLVHTVIDLTTVCYFTMAGYWIL